MGGSRSIDVEQTLRYYDLVRSTVSEAQWLSFYGIVSSFADSKLDAAQAFQQLKMALHGHEYLIRGLGNVPYLQIDTAQTDLVAAQRSDRIEQSVHEDTKMPENEVKRSPDDQQSKRAKERKKEAIELDQSPIPSSSALQPRPSEAVTPFTRVRTIDRLYAVRAEAIAFLAAQPPIGACNP